MSGQFGSTQNLHRNPPERVWPSKRYHALWCDGSVALVIAPDPDSVSSSRRFREVDGKIRVIHSVRKLGNWIHRVVARELWKRGSLTLRTLAYWMGYRHSKPNLARQKKIPSSCSTKHHALRKVLLPLKDAGFGVYCSVVWKVEKASRDIGSSAISFLKNSTKLGSNRQGLSDGSSLSNPFSNPRFLRC